MSVGLAQLAHVLDEDAHALIRVPGHERPHQAVLGQEVEHVQNSRLKLEPPVRLVLHLFDDGHASRLLLRRHGLDRSQNVRGERDVDTPLHLGEVQRRDGEGAIHVEHHSTQLPDIERAVGAA